MTPRELCIEGLLSDYPGNRHKRCYRIDRLAAEIGAKVCYGINHIGIGICVGDYQYEATSLRGAESILRYLKREAEKL